jgi:diguanylate cyclase (GGDEF)-like protein
MKILVVDDDPIQCKMIERALAKGNHEVMIRENAEAAKQVLQGDLAHFVISDWMMPELDGPSFVRWIREAPISGYVYVVLLTSRESPDDIQAGLNAGADDYIKKPFNVPELLARVAVGERILGLEESLRNASRQLESLIRIDDLTGLMNRRAIHEAGRQEIARSRRGGQPVSLLFLDLDKFKEINDTYGHASGDEVLKLVARLIQSKTRTYDHIGRWAGDEFILLLPGTSEEQAGLVSRRIKEAFEDQSFNLPNGERIKLRASIGAWTATPEVGDQLDIDALVQAADEAMYKSKPAGKPRR